MNFNFETIGYKNSSVHELLSKKYATFVTFHGQNDAKGFDWFNILMSLLAMNRNKCGIFFRKVFVRTRVLISNGFKIEFH